MSTTKRLAAALTLLTGLLALPLTAPAAADPAADAQLLIVLDASSSMLEPASDGGTRADAARAALLGVVDTLGPDERVGLRQFGATVDGLDNPDSCTDSQLTVPIAADNRQALRDAANAYLPYGETPIGYALQQAGADLSAGTESDTESSTESGNRTILLISDGESNCQPDPCAVAGELAAQGIDLTIHVVGFDVSGAARDALVCIANAGGGQYVDVTDTAGLASVFEKAVTRAFRDFALTGDSADGAPDPADAPVLTGGGRYLTRLPATGATGYYEIERAVPGSRIWVTVTMSGGPTQVIQGVLESSTDAGRSTCNSSLNFASSWSGVWNVPILSLDSTDREKCTSSDSLLLSLEGEEGSEAFAGALAEILVLEEPPVFDVEALPAATEDLGTWVPMTEAAPQPVIGGLAFSDAPTLGSGSYSFDLLPGETTYLQVPLEWGQSLQAQYTAPRGLDVTMISPVRMRLSSNDTQIDVPDPGTDVRRDAIRTPPVAYRAREHEGDWIESLAHAGTWTVAVSVQASDRNPSELVPVTLDLLIDGAVTGVPEYAAIDPDPSVGASDEPSPSAPSSAGTTPEPSDEDASDPPVSADDDTAGLPLLPIAIGAAGLGLLGLGASLLISRNRRAGRTTA